MPALRPSPIAPTVDFEREGVQHGFLRLPYSRDDSAWGSVMIPICVIRNGKGSTALLTGGNHGDEYEGPLALPRARSEKRRRHGYYRAGDELSGLPGRHTHLADRQGQHAGDFVDRLRLRQAELAKSGRQDTDYDVPYTTIHVGKIGGGYGVEHRPRHLHDRLRNPQCRGRRYN